MRYILNDKELTNEELLIFLNQVESFSKFHKVKNLSLKHPIVVYKIVLTGNIHTNHTWICDTNIDRLIERVTKYFSNNTENLTIYIQDNYCIAQKFERG